MNDDSVFLNYDKAGKMFGKCAKTIRRWIESIEDFPQPIKMGVLGCW